MASLLILLTHSTLLASEGTAKAQGVLHLAAREKTQGRYLPVNSFFNSLAAEQGSRAIAVVLSVTDGDGALGLETIKATGGITFELRGTGIESVQEVS